jgi:hypothetical protein
MLTEVGYLEPDPGGIETFALGNRLGTVDGKLSVAREDEKCAMARTRK